MAEPTRENVRKAVEFADDAKCLDACELGYREFRLHLRRAGTVKRRRLV